MTLGPAKPPVPIVLEGRYVRLEPLALHHAADLYEAASGPFEAERFAYLFEAPPTSVADIEAWITGVSGKPDPQVSAIIDRDSGKAGGRQQLMRITPEHGVIEIGGIYWGPAIARSRRATEALYLASRHVFEDLGYRRFEWKCNDRNAPSKRAAERFGFTYEGLFRQHMILKGENRDTAWFSMLDSEWPVRKAGFERWLDPENFGLDGTQKQKLDVWR